MGAIELNTSSIQCRKCGTAYGRVKGNFPVSYSQLYKGSGYLPFCKMCVDEMYETYYKMCKDPRKAVRQVCRKIDLFWSDAIYDYVSMRSSARSIMTAYIQRANSTQFIGKSYDDTLIAEGTLWTDMLSVPAQPLQEENSKTGMDAPDIDPEIRDFWGADYDPVFLSRLDKRYKKWTKDQGDLDPGAVSLFKHICILEETIAVDSAAGRPYDKNLNTLNTLLGSLNMKPAQKKEENGGNVDNSPLGVWIRRFENERPIPEPDPELQDVDKIVHYIQVFFLGHLAKMLGKTTVYSKLYEKEIARLRVEDPSLSDEFDDDEEFFENRFSVEDSDSL